MFELVGTHESVDDLGDERIDCSGDDRHKCLECGVLLDEPCEELVDEGLGIDLLLDLFREEYREGILDVLVVGQGLHRLEVALGVGDGAMPPVGDRAEGQQAQAQDEREDRGYGARSDAALGGRGRCGGIGHGPSLAVRTPPLTAFGAEPVVPRGIGGDQHRHGERGEGCDP